LRHLRSILYALVLAPAVWVLCGVGFTSDLIGRARDTTGSIESLVGLLLLLLAGGAYAILVFAPISPAGPLLAGLAFLGVGLWALAEPASYAAQWPPGLSKEGFDLSLPGYGLAVVLAVPMICTALSARRWARYEPPVLPLIGTLGRARVVGTPIAVSETTLLNARMPVPEPPTQALVLPSAEPPTDAVPTQALGMPGAEPPTDAMLTQALGMPATEPATDAMPTEVVPSQAAPVVSTPDDTASPDGDKATTLLPTLAEPDPAAGEPTTVLAPTPSFEYGEEATTALPVGPAEGSEDNTEALPSPPEEQPAAEEPTPVVAQDGFDADSEERTQRFRLPGGDAATEGGPVAEVMGDERPTGDSRPAHDGRPTGEIRAAADRPTGGLDLGQPVRQFGPGEKTQVIARNPGETTQVIRRSGAIYPPPGETTRGIKIDPGPVEPSSDRTQLIKLPGSSDAERSEPTTSVLPVSAEKTTVQQRPGEAISPNFGEASTAERPMTVLNMERPPDEAEEDTRPLDLPTQRQPQDG